MNTVYARLVKSGYFGSIPEVKVEFSEVPVKGTAGSLQRFDRLVKIYKNNQLKSEYVDNSDSANFEVEEEIKYSEILKGLNPKQEIVYDFLMGTGYFEDNRYPQYINERVQCECLGLMTADEFRSIAYQQYGVIPTLYEWWNPEIREKYIERYLRA